jgi:cell division inhibitor SepF
MSGVGDFFKNFMGLSVDDGDDEELIDPIDRAQELYPKREREREKPLKAVNTPLSSGNVVSINRSGDVQLNVNSPSSVEEARKVVDLLKEKRAVILNIRDIDRELARKIFDFCKGALYALDGSVEMVIEGIYVLAPKNVDVASDIKRKIEDTGQLPPWRS